jgi:hypothetical protein
LAKTNHLQVWSIRFSIKPAEKSQSLTIIPTITITTVNSSRCEFQDLAIWVCVVREIAIMYLNLFSTRAWQSCMLLALLAASTTGCQIVENGQTLPSPYYLHDDVQYFPPGPEFPLTNEAAAQKAYRAEEEARRR